MDYKKHQLDQACQVKVCSPLLPLWLRSWVEGSTLEPEKNLKAEKGLAAAAAASLAFRRLKVGNNLDLMITDVVVKIVLDIQHRAADHCCGRKATENNFPEDCHVAV